MRLGKVLLALGVAALLACPAFAQRGRGGAGGFPPPSYDSMLKIKKVQKDLDVDKDALTKVEDAMKKAREDHKDDFEKARPPFAGGSRDVSEEDRAKARKVVNEVTEKTVKGALSDKQFTRLKQIRYQVQIQMQGPGIFNDENVQKALKLSDEQKDKIKDIQKDLQKDVEEVFSGGFDPDKFQENMKKVQGLNKEALTNAKKTLKDDQKKQFEELTGKALELTQEDLREAFPGRGGRGGAGGAGRGRPGADRPPTDNRKIEF
jgi:hypothetical protein